MDIRTPGTTHLTDAQRIDWLRLIRSHRVGPHGIMAQTAALIVRGGSAASKMRRPNSPPANGSA